MARSPEQPDPKEKHPKPAPLETDTGEQRDDNIDDLGRRPDGSKQELPKDGPDKAPSKKP